MYGTKFVNDDFFREVVKDAPDQAKVLLVYFAKDSDRIEENVASNTEQFNHNKGSKTLLFETAKLEQFRDQVASSDIIFLHGGFSKRLLDALRPFPDLKQMFDGKIIAADSAGANVLCEVFYSQIAGEVLNGFGLLPIRMICHYDEKYKDVLNDVKPELETWYLPEYRFRIAYTE